MIPLPSLRSALLAQDPFAEMDRLIRSQLAAGRTTREIFDELNPLLDLARSTPGITVEGEEALFGTMDALTGDCHPDCRYTDQLTESSLSGNGTIPTSSHPITTSNLDESTRLV